MKILVQITMVVLMVFLSAGTLRSQDLGDITFSYGYESSLRPRYEEEGLNTATEGRAYVGRALKELQIELICAHSPQAKGRVERANQTLQDRLTKELRLRELSSLAAANAYLPEFIADQSALCRSPTRGGVSASAAG